MEKAVTPDRTDAPTIDANQTVAKATTTRCFIFLQSNSNSSFFSFTFNTRPTILIRWSHSLGVIQILRHAIVSDFKSTSSPISQFKNVLCQNVHFSKKHRWSVTEWNVIVEMVEVGLFPKLFQSDCILSGSRSFIEK